MLTTLASSMMVFAPVMQNTQAVLAAENQTEGTEAEAAQSDLPDIEGSLTGGGYAATGQLEDTGYSCVLYNSTNGLPTSDANTVLATRDGYVWIGSYSGLIRYDGSTFERLDSSKGFANAKSLFEDSKGRLWVGTNDNGIVVSDNGVLTYYTYVDGLPASTVRGFAEDRYGTIYAALTGGIVCIDSDMKLSVIDSPYIKDEYIIRIVSDVEGNIVGNTRSGGVFRLDNKRLTSYYSGEDLGIGKVSTIFADPEKAGYVYMGTETAEVYYGSFNNTFREVSSIDVKEGGSISYIDYACGRIWLLSESVIGYLDEDFKYHSLGKLP